MPKTHPQPISKVLDELFTSLGYRERLLRANALEAWPEVVGEQIARVTEAEKVVGSKLFIKVESSAWRNELLFKKQDIIKKLNAFVGKKVINDILFH